MPLATLQQVRRARDQVLSNGEVPTALKILVLLGKQYSVASVVRNLERLDHEAARQGAVLKPSIPEPKIKAPRNDRENFERLRKAEHDNRVLRDQLRQLQLDVIEPLTRQVYEQAAMLSEQQKKIDDLIERSRQTDAESAVLRSELRRSANAEVQMWWQQQQLERLYQQRLTYTAARARPYHLAWPKIIGDWVSDHDEEAHMEHPAVTYALFQAHQYEQNLDAAYGHLKEEHPRLLGEIEALKRAMTRQQEDHASLRSEIKTAFLLFIAECEPFDRCLFQKYFPESFWLRRIEKSSDER